MAKPITGNDGKATFSGTDILQVRGWTLSDSSDNKAFVSSATAGQTRRVKANQDWTASVTVFFDDGSPPTNVAKGDIAELELFTAQGAGVGGKYVGEGIVESIEPETDVEGGELIGATINFAADGAMVFTANP